MTCRNRPRRDSHRWKLYLRRLAGEERLKGWCDRAGFGGLMKSHGNMGSSHILETVNVLLSEQNVLN